MMSFLECRGLRNHTFAVMLVCLLAAKMLPAEEVNVRHAEGVVHGFLVVRTLDGKQIASGDLTQNVQGDRVMSRLIYRFKDGSIDDDTAVFSQRGTLRVISDHHIQRGPSFPHATDVSIEAATGQVTVHSMEDGKDSKDDKDNKDKTTTDHIDLPPDLANGIILGVMKNLPPDVGETKISLLAATPKPRLVKLAITPHGEDSFSAGGWRRKATHYVVKVEIGGVAGAIAPIIGKQPADTSVWILGGKSPAFVKSEGPFYQGGPVWRVELASPVWSHAASEASTRK